MANVMNSVATSRLIIKNLPTKIEEKRIRKIFKDYSLTDVKLLHNDQGAFRGFCFIGLPDVETAKAVIEKFNSTYIDTSKIKIEFALPISQSQPKTPLKTEPKPQALPNTNIFEINEEDKEEFEEFLRLHGVDPKFSRVTYIKTNKTTPKEIDLIDNEEAIKKAENEEDMIDSSRLFVRNLPYSCNEEDIENIFKKYGPVAEVHLPRDGNTLKGFGFVTFESPACAVEALNNLDGSAFQGRVIHIIPAKAHPKLDLPESLCNLFELILAYKTKKFIAQRQNTDEKRPEWNTLFLDHKVVADLLSQNFSMSKEELLKNDKSNTTPAVRLALGETDIVENTRRFLLDNGVCIDAFEKGNLQKSNDTLLVKNLPAGTTQSELLEFFKNRLNCDDMGINLPTIIFPPFGITAILKFSKKSDAKNALKALYFTKFKKLPFYIEWAPYGSFVTPNSVVEESNQTKSSIVYVKNLNYNTDEAKLREKFLNIGKIIRTTIAKSKSKENNQLRSIGYGFIEFSQPKDAINAVKRMQHTLLDGHRLVLSISKPKKSGPLVNKKSVNTEQNDESVILVKNIPFEAEKTEIEQLFRVYGRLRKIRMPMKLHENKNRHRGFAFVEFVTKEDASNAFEALKLSTHLYGRRLVLEWANKGNSLEVLRDRAADTFANVGPTKRKKSQIHFNDTDNQYN